MNFFMVSKFYPTLSYFSCNQWYSFHFNSFMTEVTIIQKCSASQCTGFYMVRTSVMKWLIYRKIYQNISKIYDGFFSKIFNQQQSFADVFENRCSKKFRKFQWKTPVSQETPTQVFFCKICKKHVLYRTTRLWRLLK